MCLANQPPRLRQTLHDGATLLCLERRLPELQLCLEGSGREIVGGSDHAFEQLLLPLVANSKRCAEPPGQNPGNRSTTKCNQDCGLGGKHSLVEG